MKLGKFRHNTWHMKISYPLLCKFLLSIWNKIKPFINVVFLLRNPLDYVIIAFLLVVLDNYKKKQLKSNLKFSVTFSLEINCCYFDANTTLPSFKLFSKVLKESFNWLSCLSTDFSERGILKDNQASVSQLFRLFEGKTKV